MLSDSDKNPRNTELKNMKRYTIGNSNSSQKDLFAKV